VAVAAAWITGRRLASSLFFEAKQNQLNKKRDCSQLATKLPQNQNETSRE
jgi:hypothetical protein